MISEVNIDPLKAYALCEDPAAGAILQFVGVVRNNTNNPKPVKALFYEAHKSLAETKIKEIVEEAINKFKLKKAHCIHRVGLLQLGEIAIVVTTAGAHREETYEGNRYIVDRVKYEAPIWKKEIFEDDSTQWGENSGKKPSFIK